MGKLEIVDKVHFKLTAAQVNEIVKEYLLEKEGITVTEMFNEIGTDPNDYDSRGPASKIFAGIKGEGKRVESKKGLGHRMEIG